MNGVTITKHSAINNNQSGVGSQSSSLRRMTNAASLDLVNVNVSGWCLDLIRTALENTDMEMRESIANYIVIPTTTKEFNLALALVSIVLMLIAQFKHL